MRTPDVNPKRGRTEDRPLLLLVEDNPVERQLVCKLLRNADFDVVAVDCGGVALDAVLQQRPDLLLLDALLPDIDGFEVCEQLRAHALGAHIPVIMLTGLDDVGSIDRAYEAGATDFFTKPINHSLLVHRIRYLLRASEINAELRLSRSSLASAQRMARLGHWEVQTDRRRFRGSEELRNIYFLDDDCDLDDWSLISARCHPEDREWVRRAFYEAYESGSEVHIEHRLLAPDNSVRYIEVLLTHIEDEAAGEPHLMGISMDVTERKESEREILRLAYFDRLTGLASRSLLERSLERAVPRAHLSGSSVALLSLDLDLFSRLNNVMGHGAGDAVLKQVTERVSALVRTPRPSDLLERLSLSAELPEERAHDLMARLAGDNFAIMLAEVDPSGQAVEQLAQRIRRAFVQPFSYRGQELFVTASIGITYSESGSATAETLLQQADLAMHEAKDQGRNQIRRYHGGLVARVSTQLAIQSDLRRALRRGEFVLHYQPKLSLHDGTLTGLEALVRWQHPTRGMVPPAQFITVAEETGQIVELGDWVLEAACRQQRSWQQSGVCDVRMAVNVSARQFRDRNFVKRIFELLARHQLAPDRLELEITEGVLMAEHRATDALLALREGGVALALDDFGTGFSSLSYLLQFPIDSLKIDRSFVKDITAESQQAAIVSAVTQLSHRLAVDVVAEGVETAEELAVVRALGCNHVQGYFHCRPLPVAELESWLLSHKPTVNA